MQGSQHSPTSCWVGKYAASLTLPTPPISYFFLFLHELSYSDLGSQLGLLCFWQVFPVSKKVHTTRCQALGVITEKEAQVVGTCKGSPANWTAGELKRVSLTVRPEENVKFTFLREGGLLFR